MAEKKIEVEHGCPECEEFFPRPGPLYVHLREHGYSVERAHSHYQIAHAIEKMARGGM